MADIIAPNGGGTTNGTETDDVITSGPNVDTINGLGGNDIIVSGFASSGPDNLTGGPGNDTFRITANAFGFVNITDFTRGQDKIDVAALGFADLASLLLVGSQQDGLSRFEFYQGGSWSKIDVIGVPLSSFVASDFVFNTSTASRNVTGTLNLDTLVGGLGDDDIYGGAGPDIIIGGPGNDTLDGGADDDQFFGGAGNDTLLGDLGRDFANFSGNRSDYRITIEGYGARIEDLRPGNHDGSDYLEGIDELTFADGTFALAVEGFQLLASDGFVGTIGGSGKVFGTAGFQDISVFGAFGRIDFDGSFNRGGDIIRLPGDASNWQVKRTGSAAEFFDGATAVRVPFGNVGMAIVFDDGQRVLKLAENGLTALIGSQAVSSEEIPLSAAAQFDPLPTGANPSAQALLLLTENASVTAGGALSIFGTPETEQVRLLPGNAILDGSFNGGGDTLVLDRPATDYSASLVGSGVFLDSALIDVRIPIGTNGMTLQFPEVPDRILVFDPAIEIVTIGTQTIGITPVALAPFA